MPLDMNCRPKSPDEWLADTVASMARYEGFSRVGLITTERAYAEGGLRRHLVARGLRCPLPLVPERRELLYANELLDHDAEGAAYHLLAVARALREQRGAQRVLLACPRYERLLLTTSQDDQSLIFGVQHISAMFRRHWEARGLA